MVDQVDLSQVNWARAQFALTAIYHWLFVPLTLGLSFLLAFFESIYVKTGNEEWKRLTKFWMTLFAINFAIGVATGLILEFQFGTNWSKYSWMVGDIFGAPLAIEGIFAFFLEASFFAIMFFGWNRVSKGLHLFSTWMVAIGSSLSAVWILVANGWMQFPIGMAFNPDNARFEMQNFADIVFSPIAVSKFTHATSSSFVLASCFVVGISSWFLLKGRHELMAKRSIAVAAIFGILSSVYVAFTGDEAAYNVAHKQPMKLAAMEGLYEGQERAPIVGFGIPNPYKEVGDNADPFIADIKIPGLLSLLANREMDSFVPGINDLVLGNQEQGIRGARDRIESGKIAVSQLGDYKKAVDNGNLEAADRYLSGFNQHREDLGYGYLNSPSDAVPPVATTFYAFHIMVVLGVLFPIIFLLFLVFLKKGNLATHRWLLNLGILAIPLSYIASELGWIVAEVGRQPWAIQGLLPVNVANSNLTTATVQTTFFVFLLLFTLLLIAEVRIILKQIKIGPEEK
ncbi:MAG: cytochrome ubiquinol oxidase subunit I [Desulfurivibrionaceae bacterium]